MLLVCTTIPSQCLFDGRRRHLADHEIRTCKGGDQGAAGLGENDEGTTVDAMEGCLEDSGIRRVLDLNPLDLAAQVCETGRQLRALASDHASCDDLESRAAPRDHSPASRTASRVDAENPQHGRHASALPRLEGVEAIGIEIRPDILDVVEVFEGFEHLDRALKVAARNFGGTLRHHR